MGATLPLDRVTGLPLDPGAHAVVTGGVRSSLDGSVFLVDGERAGGELATRPGGLFDLQAGGFAVVARDVGGTMVTLAASGDPGAACVAAHVPSPCFVPRLGALALERLKTGAELAPTLSGQIEVAGLVPAAEPPVAPWAARAVGGLALVLGVALALLALVAVLRRRARSALGRVRKAGLEALAAVRRDDALAPLRQRLVGMLRRAEELDAIRRACLRRLASLDRGALERRRDAAARSASPDARDALEWLTAEQAEATRLEGDLASSVLGLERIESALRVVALRARRGRGVRAREDRADPVDLAALELALHEEARSEVEQMV